MEVNEVSSEALEKRINELKAEISEKCSHWQKRQKFYSKWNNALVISSLLIGFLVVVVGSYDMGKVAAGLGALMTALVGGQKAFPLGEKSAFYRIGTAESEGLILELGTLGITQTYVRSIREEFGNLIQRMAREVPLVQAIQEADERKRLAVERGRQEAVPPQRPENTNDPGQ